jgi:hypothetical protein
LHTHGFFIDEASMRAAVLIDEVQRVAREVEGIAADFAFDEVGVLVSCGREVSQL